MDGISIREYTDYCESEIMELYRSVGWTNYTNRRDMLRRAYARSLLVLGAFDADRLVGIVRVVGDGCSIIYIQDLLVLPEYQRQHIGTRLLGEVLHRFADVYQKILLTERTDANILFYKRSGFVPVDDLQCVGMQYVGDDACTASL